ncbi:hypothetical protein AB0I66_24520 [Streptomyces sp. NPDC050439]|uniref:hypothetical protein n=1 Tax=unclassified Streptomyces TaxID=2593676 RepID=UPI003447D7C8
MKLSIRILRWHYLAAAALAGHCAAKSAQHDAYWYAAGLFITSLLLLVAYARECVVAQQRREDLVRAERAARLHGRQDQAAMTWGELDAACCLRAWETNGADHDAINCVRKERTV